jgi:hypothetical protein
MQRAAPRTAPACSSPHASVHVTAPRRAAAAGPAPHPRRAPRPLRRLAPPPRAQRAEGDGAAPQSSSAPDAAPLSWWQKLARDLDLGPAGFEDGSARGVMGAMDFGEASTPEEAEALAAAKEYVGGEGGERMTAEQRAALQRKIGGSYKGFFKEWVEPKGDAVDRGIVFYDEATGKDLTTSNLAYAPLLAATLAGVGAVLYVLVTRT